MKKFNHILKALILIISAMLIITPLSAQKKGKKGKKGASEATQKPADQKPKKKKGDLKSIEEATKKCKKIEGLFTLYQDTTNGSAYMLVKKEQFEKEFIYFRQLKNGPLSAGVFRGAYFGQEIFKINKHYGNIELIKQNTRYYFDPNNALSKASDANISNAIMINEKIVAQDSAKTEFLIKADGIFLSENLQQIKRPRFPGQRNPFNLGRLSRSKTKYSSINNYPENTNIDVEYTYENPSPTNFGIGDVTDARYVSISLSHYFVEVPDNNFKPRFDDPRVGYFLSSVTDMTSTSSTPYRDMINRWNLEKKDPNAAVSEPVEPITWWIENTTPVEFRETIKEGVLEWNKAFEKAGFKNAVVVKIQPDDADWDAGDIRYNVLRWTSSPNPPFGGYGPSFTNPRTGQILGADIMLEYVHFTNRVRYTKLYNFSAQEAEEHSFSNHYPDYYQKHAHCNFSDMLQNNMMFGNTVLKAAGASDLDMEGMKKEAMMALAMHEVGHTLGLNHNMKASQLFSPAELADKNVIEGKALTGSVMDYATINITRDRSKQSHYYDVSVGPYDVWAIQYGYTPFKSEAEMKALLERSTEPALIFGNDADDMRAPGKAIDPRVMVGDMSNDQITYSIDRFELIDDLVNNLKKEYTESGNTYHELVVAFNILTAQKRSAARTTSRFIGGVYVDRAFAGQKGEKQPFTPVAYNDQKRAMATLSEYLFAANAFDAPSELYNYLQIQRRGFNHFGRQEDPHLHDRALDMQKDIMNHILHRNVLQRLVDSELYGNKYKISEYMTDLNNAIFKADQYSNVNSMRQNLQLEYTNRLIAMVTGKQKDSYCYQARSMALYNLDQIKRIASRTSGNTATRAHRAHLKMLIEKAMDK